MAERRCLAKAVMLSDAFLDMPASACKLYTTMVFLADPEGVIGSPKTCVFVARATSDDLQLLIAKGFVLPLANGVMLIKHWWVHNKTPRKDTFQPSTYQDELEAVRMKDDRSYTLKPGPKPGRKALPQDCGKSVENFTTSAGFLNYAEA